MKAFKIGGIAIFLGLNAYMAFQLITAYDDGVKRGERIHKSKEALKNRRYILIFIGNRKMRKRS